MRHIVVEDFTLIAVKRKTRVISSTSTIFLQGLPVWEKIRSNLRDKIFRLESAGITES